GRARTLGRRPRLVDRLPREFGRCTGRRTPLLPAALHRAGQRQHPTNSRRVRAHQAGAFYDRRMSLEWEQTIVDARDPRALGLWWRDALEWVVVNDDADEFEIRPAEDRLPGLLFVPVPEPKTSQNRLHLDFRPDDRDAEVERL